MYSYNKLVAYLKFKLELFFILKTEFNLNSFFARLLATLFHLSIAARIFGYPNAVFTRTLSI